MQQNGSLTDVGLLASVRGPLFSSPCRSLLLVFDTAQGSCGPRASAVRNEPVTAMGTPLYTDVRLYGEAGIPGVIYGAGPRTVLESHAKRSDERVALEDLRRATKVIARTLADLLA